MIKDEYIKEKKRLTDWLEGLNKLKEKNEMDKNAISDLKVMLQRLREEYIEENRPCNLDTLVKIVLSSGRVVLGSVKDFGILDNEVCVTAYRDVKDNKETGPNKYISVKYKSIEVQY